MSTNDITDTRKRPSHDLEFAHANVGYVLDGLETATVRYGLEFDPEPGDFLSMRTPSGNWFDTAEIVAVETGTVREASYILEKLDADHPSDNPVDLRDSLRGHYETQDIGLCTTVTVIQFRIPGVTGEAERT